ncbi:citrate lyase holo-[acyl-carrier protein] synthase [Mycoplasmatota bacterium]|nr:citrate lyase holo-[acyl-carrier protein] synthase [Mycoplasmatota bacterium]
MMTISDEILDARENRYLRILKLHVRFDTLVSLKVNYPGSDKNESLVYLILNAFNHECLPFSYEKVYSYESLDGPYYLFGVNEDAKSVKKKTIELEETHELGRFIDVDVYNKKECLSRSVKRKCYLCGRIAHECVRLKKHSFEELNDYINETVINFYLKHLYDYIDQAMMVELDLDPKFGLVTKSTCGSHEDMDYSLMIKTKKEIIPYFLDMFKLSVKIDKYEDFVDDFRKLGLQAEQAMYKVTNHVNTYKGLIFHMGLMISTYGYMISRENKLSFTEMIQRNAQLFLKPSHVKNSTFGDVAQQKYNIKGAKGEALEAYPHVREALKLYNNQADALKVLVYLIYNIEDTNLLKRSKSLDFYKKVKKLFKELNINHQNQVNQLSEYCIEHRLSFGGSADLLIVTIFIKKLMENHKKISFL